MSVFENNYKSHTNNVFTNNEYIINNTKYKHNVQITSDDNSEHMVIYKEIKENFTSKFSKKNYLRSIYKCENGYETETLETSDSISEKDFNNLWNKQFQIDNNKKITDYFRPISDFNEENLITNYFKPEKKDKKKKDKKKKKRIKRKRKRKRIIRRKRIRRRKRVEKITSN